MFERGALRIVRCGACAAVYCSPRSKEPGAHFRRSERDLYEESRLIFEGAVGHHRDANYDDDIRLLERYRPRGRLIDVGTNLGMFVRRARGHGWELHGVEPSPGLAAIAARHEGVDIRAGSLEDARYPSDHFDVAVLTDVLEHVPEPYPLLAEIRRVLVPGGVLLVKVPNVRWNELKFAIAQRLGRVTENDIFDAHERIVQYSETTLVRALRRSGFDTLLVDIARPVQSPVWHRYVGRYYQYEMPWALDMPRRTARYALYLIGRVERLVTGRVGSFAPNIRVLAVKT